MRPTELIKMSGLPAEQVAAWIMGASEPTRSELRDMAIALHVSVRELIAPLEAPTPPVPLDMIRTTLPDVIWNEDRARRWGSLPFGPWGYLRLQTTHSGKVKWYPVSAMQAAELDDGIGGRDRSVMIVAPTANNRVLLFAMSRMHSAELIDAETARRRDDFEIAWDGDGLAPELYRALREWADADLVPLLALTSAAAGQRLGDLIEHIGLRRRRLLPRLDDTIIDHVDGRRLRFAVDERDLRATVRNIPLGALMIDFSEDEGTRELQLPLECIRLIDMPATDLGLVPAVVLEDSAQAVRMGCKRGGLYGYELCTDFCLSRSKGRCGLTRQWASIRCYSSLVMNDPVAGTCPRERGTPAG